MCDSPHYAWSTTLSKNVPLPCGKCPPCKKRRVDGWVFRLLQEDKISSNAHFITLTYAPKHLPKTRNGLGTLVKSDYQNFMKRLRKLTKNKIKYYAVGEYGETFLRPHYHAIIFNVPDPELYRTAWTLAGSLIGTVDVGKVSGDSIAYCAGYIDKLQQIPKFPRDDRLKEFSLMSKGLGANYITPATQKYHVQHLNELYLTKSSGHKIAMPKYYRDKLFTEQQKKKQLHIVKKAVEKIEQDREIDHFRKYDGDYETYRFMKKLTRKKRYDARKKTKRRQF